MSPSLFAASQLFATASMLIKASACPSPGPEFELLRSRWFYRSVGKMDYVSAKADCAARGAVIASIDNVLDNASMKELFGEVN